MDLGPYVTQLADSITTSAATGDEAARQAATHLLAALEPATRLTLMAAMSDLAADVTHALDGPRVELRLDGRDVSVVVTSDDWPEPLTAPAADDSGETSRITLRLPETLKVRADEAATSQGISLNAWLVGAVQSSLNGHQTRRAPSGGRVSGWVTG